MVRDPLLLVSETTVELVAALFKETVQVLDELLPKVEGEQTTEEICGGALTERVKGWDDPFKEAVRSAV
jgi:hypothetical protein